MLRALRAKLVINILILYSWQNNDCMYSQASHLEAGLEVHHPVADVGDLGAEQDRNLVEVVKRGEVSV